MSGELTGIETITDSQTVTVVLGEVGVWVILCPEGKIALSGGIKVTTNEVQAFLVGSLPSDFNEDELPTAWEFRLLNADYSRDREIEADMWLTCASVSV